MKAVRKIGLAVLALVVLAPVASACVAPRPDYETSGVEVGPTCSRYEYRKGDNNAFRASEVVDQSGGVVSQILAQNNGCFGEAIYMVADCKSGTAALIGADEDDWWRYEIAWEDKAATYASFEHENGRDYAVLLSLRQADKSPYSITPEGVLALASRLNFSLQTTGKTTGSLRYGDYQVNLGCGCKLFYPDSAGATQ